MIQINNRDFSVTGNFLKIARLDAEWHENVTDPEVVVKQLKKTGKADIFTFWQRLAEDETRYGYFKEFDNVAALKVTTFDHWWKKQINAKTRNMARRAEKKGVVIKDLPFDDKLVEGIKGIFDETPIRQGKPFWHYQKEFETVKMEMSDRLDKSDFICAFFEGELIGFIKLLYAGKYAITTQIISKIEHRDKAVNNALISRAVQRCEETETPYLVYANWSPGSLGDFKRHCGFKKIDLPRYYIPLTLKGSIALKLQLHHGIAQLLPEKAKAALKNMRKERNLKKHST